MAAINHTAPDSNGGRDQSVASHRGKMNKLGYTRRELSEALGVSIRSVARAEARKQIRALSTWRTKVYSHSEVERFLKDQMWSGEKTRKGQ